MQERVLFVHAHPDDETISTGGTIATLVGRGAHVTVLTCTRGERGEVIDPAQRALEGDFEGLAAARTQEIASAMRALGVTDHRFLGAVGARHPHSVPRRYRDSGMSWGVTATGVPTAVAAAETDQDSFTAAEFDEIFHDVDAVIDDVAPQVIVSYDANGGYGHPDHVRAYEVARAAAHEHGIPFFVIEAPDATAPRIIDVDVTPVMDRKLAALGAYRTQLEVHGHEFVSPGGQVEPISATERFRRIRPVPIDQWRGSSMLTKVALCAIALVIGAFAGATMTVAHQASAVVGELVVPWGVIAGVGITAALLAGLRIVFHTRIVPGFAALGLLGAAAFLASQSAGGSILVPDNVAGYVWTFAPVVIAGLVLAWPRVTVSPQVHRTSRGTINIPAAKGPDPL